MKKIFLWAPILTLLFCTMGINAQNTDIQTNISIVKNNAIHLGSIKSNFTDSITEDSLDIVLSDQLDSMVGTWYAKKAFAIDTLHPVANKIEDIDLPDSVYIGRLQNLDSYIPMPFNDAVKKYINFYINKRNDKVSIMMGLTDYYFPIFEETLAKYNLPIELKYLPIIESALNPKIVSRAGASGLWQFMHRTGKMYGLEINSYIDERNDPIKSTDAAARYLRDLYAIYGDWHIVIAAYNCGPGNVNKAVRRSGGKQNYWEIYSKLPKETRGYIPIFIAANYVMNYAKDHNLNPVRPSFRISTDSIVVSSYLNFEQIATNLNIPIEEIRQLNPQYKRDIIPAKPAKHYALILPIDKISSFIDNEAQIFAYNREKYFPNDQIVLIKEVNVGAYNIAGKKKIYYSVKEGDNPGSIAYKFRVGLNNLREWNNIRNMIHIGQKLVIYVNDNLAMSEKTATKTEMPQASALSANAIVPPQLQSSITGNDINGNFTFYTVRRGDSLYTIAKQFAGVSDTEIKILNNIKNPHGLVVGQRLRIPVKA